MTTVEVVGRELDPETGLARVMLVFREPLGLKQVRVFSDVGVEITPIEQPEECPNEHFVTTPWILALHFPLQAEALSCGRPGTAPQLTGKEQIGPLAPEVGGLPGTGPEYVGGCPATDCPPAETAECLEAIRDAHDASGEMWPLCDECERLQAEVYEHEAYRDVAWAVVAFASALIVIFLSVLPWPANFIAAGIAAVIALAALAVALWAESELTRLRRELAACQAQLDALRARHADAHARVLASCCCFFLFSPPC